MAQGDACVCVLSLSLSLCLSLSLPRVGAPTAPERRHAPQPVLKSTGDGPASHTSLAVKSGPERGLHIGIARAPPTPAASRSKADTNRHQHGRPPAQGRVCVWVGGRCAPPVSVPADPRLTCGRRTLPPSFPPFAPHLPDSGTSRSAGCAGCSRPVIPLAAPACCAALASPASVPQCLRSHAMRLQAQLQGHLRGSLLPSDSAVGQASRSALCNHGRSWQSRSEQRRAAVRRRAAAPWSR
jgi:hypothetical protein